MMSLDKAIKYRKEHRKAYRGAKAVDEHCRNHGGNRNKWECEWCKGNRTYKNTKKQLKVNEMLKEIKTEVK